MTEKKLKNSTKQDIHIVIFIFGIIFLTIFVTPIFIGNNTPISTNNLNTSKIIEHCYMW